MVVEEVGIFVFFNLDVFVDSRGQFVDPVGRGRCTDGVCAVAVGLDCDIVQSLFRIVK